MTRSEIYNLLVNLAYAATYSVKEIGHDVRDDCCKWRDHSYYYCSVCKNIWLDLPWEGGWSGYEPDPVDQAIVSLAHEVGHLFNPHPGGRLAKKEELARENTAWANANILLRGLGAPESITKLIGPRRSFCLKEYSESKSQ